MFCSMGVTFLSCRSELREVAAGLMRPKAPKAGKRVFLEYIPFIWKRLKFLQKVSVRNILRYKNAFYDGCGHQRLYGTADYRFRYP